MFDESARLGGDAAPGRHDRVNVDRRAGIVGQLADKRSAFELTAAREGRRGGDARPGNDRREHPFGRGRHQSGGQRDRRLATVRMVISGPSKPAGIRRAQRCCFANGVETTRSRTARITLVRHEFQAPGALPTTSMDAISTEVSDVRKDCQRYDRSLILQSSCQK